MKAPHLVVASLLFATTVARAAERPPKLEPDVVYGHKDGLAMTLDVFRHGKNSNGAGILFMVSGGWVSRWRPPEDARTFFMPLLNDGYTVFAVRHGSSPRYGIPDAVSDVRRAVRFVRLNADRFGVEANRLGAFGMSAGGHLSLMLATTGDDGDPASADALQRTPSRVAAVVAFVPPTDLRVAVWDAPESLPTYREYPALDLAMEKAAENSPLVHVTPDDAPALVIMGGADGLVPPKHGEWIDAAFEREKVERKLIVYPGVGHDLGPNFLTAVVEARDWFATHLAAAEQGAGAPASAERSAPAR